MGHNIEIKAHASNWSVQTQAAARIADEPPILLGQTDTFFNVSSGRLKLREFQDGSAELIQYDRADATGPKLSSYVRSPVAKPKTLKKAFETALGIRAIVAKNRLLYRVGQTRIHLDDVSGLGRFIELEVVLQSHQTANDGMVIARQIMAHLKIRPSDLVAKAYVDLLVL